MTSNARPIQLSSINNNEKQFLKNRKKPGGKRPTLLIRCGKDMYKHKANKLLVSTETYDET